MERIGTLIFIILLSFLTSGCVSGVDQYREQRFSGYPQYGRDFMPQSLGPQQSSVPPIRMDCDPTQNCPEIRVRGDDSLTAGCMSFLGQEVFDLCPVRGMHDASLSQDPKTGTLWLVYTHGSITFAGGHKPENVKGKHEIKLARSDDDGKTFIDVGKAFEAGMYKDDKGESPISYEVATLDPLPNGDWAIAALKFIREYEAALFVSKTAKTPQGFIRATAQSLLSGWVNAAQ